MTAKGTYEMFEAGLTDVITMTGEVSASCRSGHSIAFITGKTLYVGRLLTLDYPVGSFQHVVYEHGETLLQVGFVKLDPSLFSDDFEQFPEYTSHPLHFIFAIDTSHVFFLISVVHNTVIFQTKLRVDEPICHAVGCGSLVAIATSDMLTLFRIGGGGLVPFAQHNCTVISFSVDSEFLLIVSLEGLYIVMNNTISRMIDSNKISRVIPFHNKLFFLEASCIGTTVKMRDKKITGLRDVRPSLVDIAGDWIVGLTSRWELVIADMTDNGRDGAFSVEVLETTPLYLYAVYGRNTDSINLTIVGSNQILLLRIVVSNIDGL